MNQFQMMNSFNNFNMNQINMMGQMNMMRQMSMNNLNNMNQINNNNMNLPNNMNICNNNMYRINSMNNFNNNYSNNMNINQMKGIEYKNNFNNLDYSYVHCVIQTFACLDCFKKWFNQFHNNFFNGNNQILTKEFFNILNSLYSGQEGDSSNLINTFNFRAKNILNKEIQKDAYHFLSYFLELIHLENNNPININCSYQPTLEQMKNQNYIYNLFGSYFQQTQNSIISQCFYNIEKNKFQCRICPPLYYYTFKKLLYFKVDEYRKFRDQAYTNKIGMNLTLDECLTCYCGGYSGLCKKCNNFGNNYKTIFSTTKVLIIYFKRTIHLYKGDIDFTNKYSICNKNYYLKGCISYCNTSKYFCDVCVNKVWYRYMDNSSKMLNDVNKEIHEFEPQLLIYELEEGPQKLKNMGMNQNNSNPNFFVNPFNDNINQMMNNNQFNFIFTPYTQYQQFLGQNLQQNYDISKNLQLLQFSNTLNSFQTINPICFKNNNDNDQNDNKKNDDKKNDDKKNDNEDSNPFFATIKFYIIPENWDKNEENVIKIIPQLTVDDTIQIAVNNFFIKLQKPREAIKEFKLNDNSIDPQSQQKIKDIKSDTIIFAIKSNNFDELRN